MTALELLTAAQARISDPAKWTEGAYARTSDGRKCLPESGAATCWCALGALIVERISGNNYLSAVGHLRASAEEMFGAKVASVNDRHGHAAVMQIYADAIAKAEARA